MKAPLTPLAYSVAEAAQVAGVSANVIRGAIASTDPHNSLRAKRLSASFNGRFVIQAADLQRWLDNLPDA